MRSETPASKRRSRHLCIGISIPLLALLFACSSDDTIDSVSLTAEEREALTDDVCVGMAALGCETPVAKSDCVQGWDADLMSAAQHDCLSEFDRLLSCASTHEPYCGGAMAYPNHPMIADACPRVEFVECTLGSASACVAFTDPSNETCGVECPDASVLCQAPDPNATVQCTCDSGPHAGSGFEAANCGPDLVEKARNTCL